MFDREALIDRIYEAALVPELWPSVLGDVAALAGGVGGILLTAAPNQISRWTSSDSVRELMEAFVSDPELQSNNVRLQRGIALKHHGFFGNDALYSAEDMAQTLIYKKFFLPRGLGYAAGTILPMPSGDVAVFDIERRYDDGPVAAEQLALLDTLRPHLARSAVLATRLNLERARAVVSALGQAGLPAAVIGQRHQVLAANPELEAMAPQFVFLAHGGLALADPSANALYGDAITYLRQGDPTRSIAVPALGEAAAAVLQVLPLTGQGRDVFSGGRAILVATRLDPPAAPTAELLGGLFDLTAAEARVARAITQGLTTDEAATGLGLSRETVRSYLKTIFGKTGVGRQADLVALLSGASLPGAGTAGNLSR